MTAPQGWRIIGDQPDLFPYIPTNGSERSRRIAEMAATMSPSDWIELAAQWLAENHPAADLRAASHVEWPVPQGPLPAVVHVEGYRPDADSRE